MAKQEKVRVIPQVPAARRERLNEGIDERPQTTKQSQSGKKR